MKKILLITLAVYFSFTLSAFAKANYTFEKHINILKSELKSKNYDTTILDKAFNGNFSLDRTVVKAVKNQPEVKNSFDRYLTSKMDPFRVKEGKRLYKKHEKFLKELEAKYKIDPEVIIALWGLETNYGKYPIKYNPVKALASISYTHKRKSRRNFFKRELFALFELNKKYNINLLDIKSSWAGALGQCQFMPSNVLQYAVDGNNDGKVDIWTNDKDVLASIANFLKALRYKQEEIHFVTLDSKDFSKKIKYSRKYKNAKIWKNLNKKLNITDDNLRLRMYAPENKENKVFLVSKKFDIIKRWNNSDYFAFSVLSLAKEIRNSNN